MDIRRKTGKYCIYFTCYSIIGWIYEELLWIFEQHQVVNRGFCLGPWLPIYGFGGLALYFTAYRYAISGSSRRKKAIKLAIVFLTVSAGAALVELASTYAMEAAGLDFRTLWSYAGYAINFEERVALLPALKFGMLGCLIIYFAQGRIQRFALSRGKRAVFAKHALFLCLALDIAVHLVIGSNYTGNVLLTL